MSQNVIYMVSCTVVGMYSSGVLKICSFIIRCKLDKPIYIYANQIGLQ